MALPLRVIIACVSVLSSCSTSRWYHARFAPTPFATQISAPVGDDSQVLALVTILGIARKTGSAEVRIRLENLGKSPVLLIADSLSLVTSDLETFGPVSIAPHEDRRLVSGESASIDASFPLPPHKKLEDLSLRGLDLSWTLDFSGSKVTTNARFQRADWVGWPGESPGLNVGIGVEYWRGGWNWGAPRPQ